MIIALWQEVLKTSDWNHWRSFSFYSVDFVSALPVKPVPPLHHARSLSFTTHLCLNFILLIMVQLTEQGIILTKSWAKQIGLRQTLILFCYTPNGLLAEEHEKPMNLCPLFILNSYCYLGFLNEVTGYSVSVLDGISQTQVQMQLFETTPLGQHETLIFPPFFKYSAVGRPSLYLQIFYLEVSVSHLRELKLG